MAYKVKGVEPTHNPALAEIEKNTGTSNFLRVMAHRPEAMTQFSRFYAELMSRSAVLDPRVREMVYIAVSTINQCRYCASHHRRAALEAGLINDEIHDIENEFDERFSPKERAALQYARELTRTSTVGDGTRYRAQEHFSDDAFVELTMVVGLANFTNRFNNGLAVPLETLPGDDSMYTG